ncbi:MAG TPA: chromosome segregation protein SMC [Ornithinimicrobium sp.]|uniref:chromosome segregation protein SMC n=1 Tax=Ornithinimicrobium sp. TaxID=1977084 RepID=UPI002B48B03C|nr:chromosome segregation protein SMC [Ornithinimicrobium sp.]HKJ10896.1 chromosome segregation protein SMC [Ornithinimicrobium sp.]
MYVKSLTLRGFKSFASATTLRLEPGVTCIVGPNGSGKSNVVDALAWVMGEQGAKSLRGGKMEDVVFAGTSGRQPLGRAEVSMTIDNTDGALPIDYTEVTITRTMFRNGGSDYAINGTACRLLDIQELLSDSGIGREMHVIVGQGQLDQVLRATPEERRGFVEEAAGVLKHRKRKERALRKLETMEANLTRLSDLTTEIRRQLGPLGRQAETARRAAGIQATVRDARLRLLADEVATLTEVLERAAAAEAAMGERRNACSAQLEQVTAEVERAEHADATSAPALTRAQDAYYAATALRQRLQSTRELAAERVRLIHAAVEEESADGPRADRDPEEMTAAAARVRAAQVGAQTDLEQARATLQRLRHARTAAEEAYEQEEARVTSLLQAAADRREGLARLAGQVAAQRSRADAEEAELGRLRETEEAVVQRAREAEQEFAALEVTILDVERDEQGLDQAYELAEQARVAAAGEMAAAQESKRAAEARLLSAETRCEALRMSRQRRDGAAAWVEQAPEADEAGWLSERLVVQPGYEGQVAAALGWVGDALVVGSMTAGARGLAWLREQEHGRAGVVVPAETASSPRSGPELPEGARPAASVVRADTPELTAAVHDHLRQVVLVGGSDEALRLVQSPAGGELVAVTRAGDLYGRGWMRGGSADGPSTIELDSAVDDAREEARQARADLERHGFQIGRLEESLGEAQVASEEAMQALHRSDARMAGVAEQLGQLGSVMRSAHAERERVRLAVQESERSGARARANLADLEQRLADARAAGQAPGEEPRGPAEQDDRAALADAAAHARGAETEARLQVRTGEERLAALVERVGALEAAARDERAARDQAAARALTRRRQAQTAQAVVMAAAYLSASMEEVVERADAARADLAAAHAAREDRLRAARTRARSLAEELQELTASLHADEVARAEQGLRLETLHTRAVDEHGIDPQVLLTEFGPDQPVPVLDQAGSAPDATEAATPDTGVATPVPFVRAEQEKRLRRSERALAALGKVNPLALEEYAALEERHTYLTAQIEDLRRSSADLLGIVKEVDERVERVFAEAFEDTAAQFETVFARLFPGGEGRLVLTDPGDLLTSGIEVEARPPGKKIKRLSLLSGGERSLTAVALLVAIFKARPSPFYIMDEVEAALDDTNLGRLISLFEELRDSSQLIVITHQKRTMEVADALYGVSMQGDGITTVISQRLHEPQPA